MREVYIVAIQGPHGASVTNSDAFCKYTSAETKLKQDRERGIDYTRIFTLRIVDNNEVSK